MNVMGLTFTQIMVFATVASCIGAILTVQRWGSGIYSFGTRNIMFLACLGASLTPLFYLFSSPGNIWPTLLHNFIGAMFWCGGNLACTTMQMNASAEDTRPSYIAVFSCVTALAGTALGSLFAGTLLKAFAASGLFTGWFDRYKMLFAEQELGEFVKVPEETPGNWHTYHQYVIRAQKRDELMAFLANEGITTRVYYPLPLHLQKCFAFLGGKAGDYPESEKLAGECLALPVFPGLTMDEQVWVAETMAKFYKK